MREANLEVDDFFRAFRPTFALCFKLRFVSGKLDDIAVGRSARPLHCVYARPTNILVASSRTKDAYRRFTNHRFVLPEPSPNSTIRQFRVCVGTFEAAIRTTQLMCVYLHPILSPFLEPEVAADVETDAGMELITTQPVAIGTLQRPTAVTLIENGRQFFRIRIPSHEIDRSVWNGFQVLPFDGSDEYL
uniref:Uncharacterized protein n=1 Tax=Pristionchus pacificus TaxID=54126 RepID=A0A2A6B7I6_PRIPA|eukprot:PDM61827.1 hypothetical protein PRIPAC_51269 [Pristionchus pacificus]